MGGLHLGTMGNYHFRPINELSQLQLLKGSGR